MGFLWVCALPANPSSAWGLAIWGECEVPLNSFGVGSIKEPFSDAGALQPRADRTHFISKLSQSLGRAL